MRAERSHELEPLLVLAGEAHVALRLLLEGDADPVADELGLSARETPEMPNQKTTCSRGLAWPVLSRSPMNSRMVSGVILPLSISVQTSAGVLGV